MTIVRALSGCILLLSLLACGERQDGGEQEAALATLDSEDPVTLDSVPMPDYPDPRRGWLVANSAGPYPLRGEWPARAATCDDPPVLEVLAEQPGFGTLILLQLPAPDSRMTRYPIVVVDSGAPEPPAAQIGVQRFEGRNSYAFQGLAGEVELYGLADRVSGRYAVTLREIQTDNEAKYVGVFEGIPLQALPPEQCQAMKEALAAADSTGAMAERPQ